MSNAGTLSSVAVVTTCEPLVCRPRAKRVKRQIVQYAPPPPPNMGENTAMLRNIFVIPGKLNLHLFHGNSAFSNASNPMNVLIRKMP